MDAEQERAWKRLGATHGTMVPYSMGTGDSVGLGASTLQAQMTGMVCAFAYCGAPGAVGWLPQGKVMLTNGVGVCIVPLRMTLYYAECLTWRGACRQ